MQKRTFSPVQFTLIMLLMVLPLQAQSVEDIIMERNRKFELQQFHFIGLSMGKENRTLTLDYLKDTISDTNDKLGTGGLEYTSLIGSRLGFYSNLFLQLPLNLSDRIGILLDYTGGIGWNLWKGNWGLLPGIGFHAGYTYLQNHDFAEGENIFYVSFGIGGGLKLLYRKDRLIFYAGVSADYDSLEFTTNPRYRDRDNTFKSTVDYKAGAGVGIEL